MKILVYTDIALTERYKAGNINALMTLVSRLSTRAQVEILCTHCSRPDRTFPPAVRVVWRPDFVNLLTRKLRKVLGTERDMLSYKGSWLKKTFLNHQLAKADYDLVIVEYLENAVLLEAIRAQTRVPVVCDIHDLMSLRAQAFGRSNQAHKENLAISHADELTALGRFDAVIALQAVEAAIIRKALPELKVIVTRRAPPILANSSMQRPANPETTIGFLGTSASFNVDAARRMLSTEFKIATDVKYVIGGSVCGHLSDGLENVEILGAVDSLASFYERIDVLANMIGFGSGLKTKNLEALAHGVPVITTSVGAEGMEDLIGHGLYLANSGDEFDRAVELIKCDIARGGMRERVSSNYKKFFSPEHVFAELDGYLDSISPSQRLAGQFQPHA